MKKVLVLGCSGSGKSTFSLKLAELTGLPLIRLDALYWKPGWVAAGEAEWDAVIKEQIHKGTGIMQGRSNSVCRKPTPFITSIFPVTSASIGY